jgi:uncharacterized protein (TIGR00369 family)
MILPPYARTLGIEIASEGADTPELSLPFSPDVVGRPGFLHGGAIAGLLEFAAMAALRHALADEGVGIEPVTSTIDYLRGGRDKTTFAAGRVTRFGTRVANVEAFAWQDARDQPIAAARSNFLLVRPPA